MQFEKAGVERAHKDQTMRHLRTVCSMVKLQYLPIEQPGRASNFSPVAKAAAEGIVS